MAQAIYREWFVHFRYPGHEDATFVDSPLGPIPEGWEVAAARTIASFDERIRIQASATSADEASTSVIEIERLDERRRRWTTPRADADALVEPEDS